MKYTDVDNVLRPIYLVNRGSKIQTTTVEPQSFTSKTLHFMGLFLRFQQQGKMISGMM